MSAVRRPLLFGALLAGLLCWAATLADPGIAPFRARYALALRGIEVGEAVVELDIDAGGHYRMRAQSQAAGPLQILLPDRLTEEAEGQIDATGVHPARYVHERSGGGKREFTRIVFDAAHGEVRVSSDEGEGRLALRPDMFDPLSLQLHAMWRLRQKLPVGTITLVDDASPDAYEVTEQGLEAVDTGVGKLDALKLMRGRLGDRKLTSFWFAPRRDYLPVKVQQLRKGRETLRMTLLDTGR